MQIQPNMLQVDRWNKIRMPYLEKVECRPPPLTLIMKEDLPPPGTNWEAANTRQNPSTPEACSWYWYLLCLQGTSYNQKHWDLQSTSGKATVYLEPVCETWCKSGGIHRVRPQKNLSFWGSVCHLWQTAFPNQQEKGRNCKVIGCISTYSTRRAPPALVMLGFFASHLFPRHHRVCSSGLSCSLHFLSLL